MFEIITPITNLILEENLEEYAIFKPNQLNKILDSVYRFWIGTIDIDFINDHPSFYYAYEGEHENSTNLINSVISTNNNILGISLWLIRDCACFSPVYFFRTIGQNQVLKTSINAYFSNCFGTGTSTKFSKSDIEAAIKRHDLLLSLMNRPAIYKTKIPAPGEVSYNDYDKLYRSINFINLARKTSYLPQKISLFIVALESLFGNSEKNDLVFKLSYRIPHFFDTTIEDKLAIHKIINTSYSVRSSFLHGDTLDKKAKSHDAQLKISGDLDMLVRRVINYIIDNSHVLDIINDPSKFSEHFRMKLIS